jgi:hypothetical protein
MHENIEKQQFNYILDIHGDDLKHTAITQHTHKI